MKVTRIELPTPYYVGPVNVWLLRNEACVLIDAGPMTPESRAALEAGLKKARVGWGDIDAIVLTHGHLDHFGMAEELRRRTKAKVYAHPDERIYIEGFPKTHLRAVGRFEEASRDHGYPEADFKKVSAYYNSTLGVGEAAKIGGATKDGDILEFGSVRLEAIYTPGHTSGSVCFVDRKTESIFCGDTILERITPVTFFKGARAKTGPGIFLDSLARLKALEIRKAYPGHRAPFKDFAGAVRRIERHLALRTQRILENLKGERSAYEVALAAFPENTFSERWLSFAETLGLLELLESQGRVRRIDSRPVRFRLTS